MSLSGVDEIPSPAVRYLRLTRGHCNNATSHSQSRPRQDVIVKLLYAVISKPSKRATFEEPRVLETGLIKTLEGHAGKMSLVGRRSTMEMLCSSATSALHKLNATCWALTDIKYSSLSSLYVVLCSHLATRRIRTVDSDGTVGDCFQTSE